MKFSYDFSLLRNDPDQLKAQMRRRNISPEVIDNLVEMDIEYRDQLTKKQKRSEDINKISKDISIAVRNQQDFSSLLEYRKKLEEDDIIIDETIFEHLLELPNILIDDELTSSDEDIVLHEKGNKRVFNFTPKSHTEIFELDFGFDRATDLSGSRFSMLSGTTAALHRALGQFMLDEAINNGFLEVNPPLIVNERALVGTGQLPKFEDDLYKVGEQYLIPTAEVSLTNYAMGKKIEPTRLTALTTCFRKEAGSSGVDTKGIIRQHQFEKVELVSICDADNEQNEFEYIIECASSILDQLELPYREVLLCDNETGFSASKTHDLEVWLPSQEKYREISSISMFGDFQGRRMGTKIGKNFAHTVNGSGLAVGRTLVALLENYQNEDGSITIPPVLRSYIK